MTTKHRLPIKRISLSYEIDGLRAAISAARILVDEHATNHLSSPHDERIVPEAASAVLSLVDSRAKDLCRVLRQEKDPAALWCHVNAVDSADGDDLVLVGWTDGQPPRRRRDRVRPARRSRRGRR